MSFVPLGLTNPRADMEALDHLAARARRPGTTNHMLEVGSWAGSTALVLARHADILHCVDTWEGNPDPQDCTNPHFTGLSREAIFRTFCQNVGDKLFRSIWPHRGTSLEWAAVWPYQLRLIFLDGDHRVESVRADIAAWWPHVESGGYLVFHDYGCGTWKGVKQAVDERFPKIERGGESLAWVRAD